MYIQLLPGELTQFLETQGCRLVDNVIYHDQDFVGVILPSNIRGMHELRIETATIRHLLVNGTFKVGV